jgi:hypothetical protein
MSQIVYGGMHAGGQINADVMHTRERIIKIGHMGVAWLTGCILALLLTSG